MMLQLQAVEVRLQLQRQPSYVLRLHLADLATLQLLPHLPPLHLHWQAAPASDNKWHVLQLLHYLPPLHLHWQAAQASDKSWHVLQRLGKEGARNESQYDCEEGKLNDAYAAAKEHVVGVQGSTAIDSICCQSTEVASTIHHC